ncbi:MAG: hypothetical protein AAGA18_00220 [Verrucomicrobiota bacterium]
MGSCFFRFCTILTLFAIFALASSRAQSLIDPILEPEKDSATFADISEKFIRNMNLIATMVPDQPTAEMITIVTKQAEDALGFYRTKGAGAYRERLRRYNESLKTKDGIQKRDKEYVEKLNDMIKKRDSDGLFKDARGRIKQSINLLQTTMRESPIEEDEWKDFQRIISKHLRLYSQAMGKV